MTLRREQHDRLLDRVCPTTSCGYTVDDGMFGFSGIAGGSHLVRRVAKLGTC